MNHLYIMLVILLILLALITKVNGLNINKKQQNKQMIMVKENFKILVQVIFVEVLKCL